MNMDSCKNTVQQNEVLSSTPSNLTLLLFENNANPNYKTNRG